MIFFRNCARNHVLAACLLLIPAGLALKSYAGPARFWVNNYAAGCAYVVFWGLLFYSVPARKSRAVPVTGAVLAVTCLLEFLQLWRHPLLEAARANFWGRAILGSDFDWLDFPHYVLGALIAVYLARLLTGKEEDSLRSQPL